MTGNDRRDKVRAIFLSLLMVGSVFGATVAFSGGVAAATGASLNGLSNPADGTVNESATVVHNSANFTVDGLNDNNSGQTVAYTVYFTNGAEIQGVSGIQDTNGSISNVNVNNGNLTFTSQGVQNTGDSLYFNVSDLEVQYPKVSSNETVELRVDVDDSGGANNDFLLDTLTVEEIDNGEPDVDSVRTVGSTEEGNVDTINVTFNETLDASSVQASDFSLSSGSVDSVATNGNVVTLTVSGVGDTSATPTVNGSGVTDEVGNEIADFSQKANDRTAPVVIDSELNQTLVNNSDAPATVAVNVTFSENVSGGDVRITDSSVPNLDVTGSVNNDTFSGTVTITDNDQDYVGNLTVSGFSDNDGNTQTTFDREGALTVDTDESLTLVGASTADLNNDGTVDTINATFSDDVDDSSVLTAIENDEFNLKTGTVTGINGGVANDETVSLTVEDVGDTGSTDEITVFSGVLEDTAGNPGPNGPDGIVVDDGAKPAVTDVTVNTTEVNESDVPADVMINITYSEDLSADPTVTLVGLNSGDISTTAANPGDDDNFVSVTTDAPIGDTDQDIGLFVDASGGGDGAGNSVVTYNESDITVDTLAPTVSVNGTEAPEGEVVSGTLDLTSFFDIANDDGGETTYLINTTDGGTNYTEVANPAAFDTTTIDDTEFLTVRAVDTDDVGNSDSATTADINVDNTAPQITIESPSETTAKQTGSALTVEASVVEQNVDGNATIVLEGDGNTIQYNASVADLRNGVDLRLNTSENASANGALLPNQNETNGTFNTQTVYDLSVTVDDTTGKSTTETQSAALFLDDTPPANFSLLAPTTPQEFDPSVGDNQFQVAYGYTEDNVESVEVSLTNESGAVANVTVDESQYVNDGVIKSFELDLYESFDTNSLADGRYNVTITVTDQAGNELNDSTDNAPIAINDEDKEDGPQFNSGPDASASINESAETVAVDVTYNVSVPEVSDAGDLDQGDNDDSLDSVSIDASNVVTLTVSYWDASEQKYDTDQRTVDVDFGAANATANATITESATLNLSDIQTDVEEGDRVLDRSVSVDDDVVVIATDTGDDDTVAGDFINAGPTTLDSQSEATPDIESVEVVGPDVDASSTTLEITFTRPVDETGTVSADDFGYQDVSGDGSNFVTSVYDQYDGDATITVELNEPVTAGDVGSDIVDIQPNVFENAHNGSVDVPAVNGTVMETTAPSIEGNELGSNASTVTVTFDQGVTATNGSALTAANVSYNGSANVSSVDHNGDTVTVTLSDEINDTEVGNTTLTFDAVADQFGNEAETLNTTVGDNEAPSDIEIVEPNGEVIKQSDGLLDVTYRYTENVPENTENVTVRLVGQGYEMPTYEYEIDDSQYVDGSVEKSLTVDLDKAASTLNDGSYQVEIVVEDGSGNVETVTSQEASVVINDEAPEVTSVDVAPDQDVSPDETVNVTYNYVDATDASSVTVHVVAADDVQDFTSGDFDNSTFAQKQVDVDHAAGMQTVEVDLSDFDVGSVSDNEDYVVFVTATDASGFTNLNTNADPIIEGTVASDTLDINAEQPTITAVETNVGDNTVTVEFSEVVVAGDGDEELTRADFAYQDVNGAGASSIEAVDHNGDTVTLTLDAAVTEGDLESDLINALADQVVDTDGANARAVNTDAVALADTTAPAEPSVSAGPVNANNDESYDVTVSDLPAAGTIEVTVTGPNGANVSDSAAIAGDTASLEFNVSEFEDGQLTIDATVTDAGGNNASASVTAQKDTVAPELLDAETDANGTLVAVTVTEQLPGATPADFSVSSSAHEVDQIVGSEMADGNVTYYVVLNDTVPVQALGTVTVSSSATDAAGNGVIETATLGDTTSPFVSQASAEVGSVNVTVTVDEPISSEDGDVNASDFVYTDTNEAGAGAITAVEQEDDTTYVLTLDEAVTPGDLDAADMVALNASSVTDLAGNNASGAGVPIMSGTDFPTVSTSADDDTVTVTVETPANLSQANLSAEVTGLNALAPTEFSEQIGLGADGQPTESYGSYGDTFTATLSESDFSEVAPGTYEATFEAPSDGGYAVTATVSSEANIESASTTAEVDEHAPSLTDAVILDAGQVSGAYGDTSATVDVTAIHVTFSEPVDLSEVTTDDVSIENNDVEVIEVERAGALGSLTVYVEGYVQTADSPDVLVDADSYTEQYGDNSAGLENDTTLHTDVLHLEEGRNFVSVPAATGSQDLDELDLSGVDAIYAYDAESESWEAYDPEASENDFDELEGGKGYLFEMEESATLKINVATKAGPNVGDGVPNQQTLSEGWNLVGHYQEGGQAVGTALSTVGTDNIRDVLAQSDADTYQSYQAGDFTVMQRGEAYWVFLDNQDDGSAPYAEADFGGPEAVPR